MMVGVCKIRLRIPGNRSLKGKRRVINSLTTRVRHKFDVAISEVDDNDLWQVAILGVVCVSNNTQQVNRVLSHVVSFISDDGRFETELLDYETEIIPCF